MSKGNDKTFVPNEHDARLLLLGQIAIVRERLDKLEAELIHLPMPSVDYVGEGTADAIGNLSLQVGGLIGMVTLYQDVASSGWNPKSSDTALEIAKEGS